MQTPPEKTFAVFFAHAPGSTPFRRLFLLRHYLTEIERSGLKLVDHAILPCYNRYNFMAIMGAPSREKLEATFEPCNGELDLTIVEVTELTTGAEPSPKRIAMFVPQPAAGNGAGNTAAAGEVPGVTLQTHAMLDGTGPYGAVLLAGTADIHLSRVLGRKLYPDAEILYLEAVSPELFLQNEVKQPVAQSQPVVLAANDAPQFSVFNEGGSTAYAAPAVVNPNGVQSTQLFDLFPGNAISPVAPQASYDSSSGVYLWPSQTGQITFDYTYIYEVVVARHNTTDTYTVNTNTFDTNTPFPSLYIPNSPGAPLGFNFGTPGGGVHARTDLYFWLTDLLNTAKYDAEWPETNYAGEDLAAYNYFLDNLPGRTPPNSGNVPSTKVQAITDRGYQANPDFSLEAFERVSSHLEDECGNFELAWKWWGVNGIFGAINSQIAIVSGDALTAAAALMSIPDDSTPVTARLDAAFSIIESLLSVIPEYGAAISAVLNIGWTTAKLALGNHPEEIQTSVAKMAKDISDYLECMDEASRNNLDIINKNWGKLSTFCDGTITSIINPDDFAMSISDDKDNKPAVPVGYIDAAAKAWNIVIYQTLFAGFHTPKAAMSTSTSKPSNPWNPDAGNYEFVYYLDCQTPDSNNNPTPGLLVFDCNTDAPKEALQVLFGTNSELNINPLCFYAGIGGWQPKKEFYLGTLEASAMMYYHFPVKSIGRTGNDL